VPNSSKRPTCRPPKKTTGSPASTRRMYGAENWLLMSIPPEANRGFGNEPDGSSLTYCTSDFAPEKLLRHELRRDTDAAPVIQPDSRRLEWGLFGRRFRTTKKSGGCGQRERCEQAATCLCRLHNVSPIPVMSIDARRSVVGASPCFQRRIAHSGTAGTCCAA